MATTLINVMFGSTIASIILKIELDYNYKLKKQRHFTFLSIILC